MKPVLAQRIRAARQSIHPAVTQRDVAKRLGLSPSAINLWEAGKTEPSAHSLGTLAQWFGVSTDWLLGIASNTPKSRATTVPLYAVPVISPHEMARWQWDSASEVLQTSVSYAERTAAAMLVASDALASACPSGAYCVVSRAHPYAAGNVVLAQAGRASDPVLRRLVRDGSDDLLVADDVRFPTIRMASGVRVIGRVTEVTTRRMLI